MSQEIEETPQARSQSALFMLLIALFILIVFIGWLLWPGQVRPLKPFYPTATRWAGEFDGQPVFVSFPDLQAAPADYVNQRIRVTGDFTRIASPDCIQFGGPTFKWGLISDELQMNALGMESIMRLIPDGTPMIIEGIWRRYNGPVGCGKEPQASTVWYLTVEHILQPNPLPNFGTPHPTIPPVGDGTPLPTETAVSDENGTPLSEQTAVATITPTATPTLLSTMTPTSTPTTTPTIADPFATATLTVDGTVVPTITPPLNTTATSTPPSPNATQPSGLPTPTSGSQPPSLASSTPDFYPVNTPLPTQIPSYP